MNKVNEQECNHKFFLVRVTMVKGEKTDVFCCEKCLTYRNKLVEPPTAAEPAPYTAGERRLLLLAAALVLVLGIIQYRWMA